MFALQLVIGAFMIGLTVLIHAVSLDRLKRVLDRLENFFRLRMRHSWKVPMLVIAVLGAFCSHIVQIWLWAFFYLSVDALNTIEEALYFSTATFTTVGYGDVVLSQEWRLVSSFQAANGFMLFGWSTAFIFEIMSQLYQADSG
ncbi:MAG: two pore domain potassium channel family protein [Alphaproteobacteria bacterium]|nr:two pore domain potassium channel family protein [Alphaproteobacteria bacterium]MCB9975828.1 two pore domain potassium channel family protein [Rhodospirillales bacterium]